MLDTKKIRKDFPMFEAKTMMQNHDLVFLDNASTTFKPKSVVNAVADYLSYGTSNSGRGDYDLMYKVDTKILETRKNVAKFINADTNEIVFTAGDTASLNLVAFGWARKMLKKGDEILISLAEHASNVLPWFKLQEEIGCKVKYIKLTKEGRITVENVAKAITEKTKIIAIANVTNVLGYFIDMEEICEIAHKKNIVVVCDGAQSVPHMETDVKKMDVDFLAFSGHKMCGPTGIGILYAKAKFLDEMDPVNYGGGMNEVFEKNGEYILHEAPAKFEGGTLNIEGIYGLNEAIKYLNSIKMSEIQHHEQELRKYAIQELKKIDGITIYNETAEAGIIAFNLKDVFAQDLATLLNSKGIAVRSGNHCAKILKNQINEIATVRASFYFYTTKEDIDALVAALKEGGNFLDAYFA